MSASIVTVSARRRQHSITPHNRITPQHCPCPCNFNCSLGPKAVLLPVRRVFLWLTQESCSTCLVSTGAKLSSSTRRVTSIRGRLSPIPQLTPPSLFCDFHLRPSLSAFPHRTRMLPSFTRAQPSCHTYTVSGSVYVMLFDTLQ